MMGPYFGVDGWTAIWGMGMMVLFWGGIIALLVWVVQSFTRPTATNDPALDKLRKRFAAGEISREDFEKTKKVLGA